MSQSQFVPLELAVNKMERLGRRIESALDKKPWLSISLLSVVFMACASVKASRRPLWFDELLTYYISRLPSLSAIWKALSTGADATPPLFHLVSKGFGVSLGWTAFALRFPAILGYLIMILCVYFVVRRYAGPLYGSVGALASFIRAAPGYAVEARPYSLVVGLTGIALLCWQHACRSARPLMLGGLWLCLTTAVSLHYYAVLSIAAIGFGELVRTWTKGRIDWPVWAALVMAMSSIY